MPDAPTPAAALPDDGATARRGLAGRHLAPRGVAAIALAAAVTTAVSGCGNDSTADASTSTIAPSDMSRIAAGNTPRSSPTGPSTSLRSAASSAPATSRSALVASSAPGTTSKAGPAAVVIPEAAKAHTKDGAKAFVKFYWETLDQLDAAPKENVLANLYAPTCTGCDQQALGVAENARTGVHIEGSRTTLTKLQEAPTSSLDEPVFTFDQAETPATRVESGGKRTELSAIKLRGAVRLMWDGQHWRVGMYGADRA